ncbi:MAG: VOC family protein [Acidimicrobiia bacterium]|jgi:predicted enzyme related to lactoylglutathione lyase
MPTRDGYPEGVPSWVDLSTTDVEKARAFYEALFGWNIQEAESDSMPYWMAYQKGRAAAGLGPAQGEPRFSAWTTYFAVDDADATVAKIRDAGGQIVFEPTDIMEMGRMAIAADPSGAVFGIWQAGQHKGAGIVNEHGALNWNELQVDDVSKELEFYRAVFGHTTEETEGGSGPYYVMSAGDRPVAGAMAKPAPEIPNSWSVYFAVDDADAAVETATEHGGHVSFGPMDLPSVGKIAGLVDPTGGHFTVIQLAGEID